MRISHYNTFPHGGAATAAIRMHRQMVQFEQAQTTDLQSKFCYYRNEKNVALDDSFQQVEFASKKPGKLLGAIQHRFQKQRQREIYRQFNSHLATRAAGVETFSMAELPQPTPLDWDSFGSDIVHLHWLAYFIDFPSFFGSIPDEVPVVWTLHDMNPFTGGCHYSNHCQQFRFGCGDCGQVINRGPQDVSRSGFDAKQSALANKKIHVVTPSQWLNKLAQKSPLWPDSTTFQTIPYGFDLEQFRPVEKQQARRRLGIHSDAVLVGFGADEIHNRRKGIHHLLDALRSVHIQWCNNDEKPVADNELPRIEGLLFGAGKIEDDDGLPRLHEMGFVDSVARQRLIYSAADIVVVPSREDNQPQVGLEAMACGTPVIGFNAGGIPEYVRPNQTGLIAAVGDECELAEHIVRLASDAHLRQKLGRQARAMMEIEFEIQQQTRTYLHLYESIVGYRQIKVAA